MYNYLYLEIIYWMYAIHVVYTVEPLKSGRTPLEPFQVSTLWRRPDCRG